MKKHLLLAATLLMSIILLSSCAFIPASKLEAVFRPTDGSVITSGNASIATEETGDTDTVTISREEYEKYQRFAEVYTLFDVANQNFYKETDQDKMFVRADGNRT